MIDSQQKNERSCAFYFDVTRTNLAQTLQPTIKMLRATKGGGEVILTCNDYLDETGKLVIVVLRSQIAFGQAIIVGFDGVNGDAADAFVEAFANISETGHCVFFGGHAECADTGYFESVN